MSESVWSPTSRTSPSPPKACRTTATFSARAGSMSSRSGFSDAKGSCACGARGGCRATAGQPGLCGDRVRYCPPPPGHTHRDPAHRPARTAGRAYSARSRARPPAPVPFGVPRSPAAADGDFQMTHHTQPAQAEGLYDPRFEHDACGVAMVARLDDTATHEVVERALEALDNLEHRGAEGADVRTGDGAGILVQLPDAFLRAVAGVDLPEPGRYGVAMCFLPQDPTLRAKLQALLELNVRVEGQKVLGWRDVPVDDTHVGETANRSRPYVKQLFVGAGPGFESDQDAFERKLYVIRRIVELAAGPDFYTPSFSSRTCVYKGMLISSQLRLFY